MKNLILLISSMCFFSFAQAQKINLVKDIWTGSGDSSPEIMAADAQGNIFFSAITAAEGRELYWSDGTTSGTKLLKAINPGAGSGIDKATSVYANGKLYFIGDDGTNGPELWVSDGTAAGTKMVKDINTQSGQGCFSALTVYMEYLNGKLLFNAKDATHGHELWESDGTAAGTKRLKDIHAGNLDGNPEDLMISNGKLYFFATDGGHGIELWESDGTSAGTKMAYDLFPGTSNGVEPTDIVSFSNKIYYCGRTTNASGFDLYAFDGTSSTLVKDINTNTSASSHIDYFTIAGNKLYFKARDLTNKFDVWVTDGTTAGTKKASTSLNPNGTIRMYGALNNKLVFSFGSGGVSGEELWGSDGTTAGTKIIKDIYQGNLDGKINIDSEPYYWTRGIKGSPIKNNVFYFAANDGTHAIELWQTNGTESGTMLVEDLANNPPAATSRINYIFVNGSKVWLAASNGTSGRELYSYNIPVSINSINKQAKISALHPNPSTGAFVVTLGDNSYLNGYLKVVDVTGRIVYDQSIAQNQKRFM